MSKIPTLLVLTVFFLMAFGIVMLSGSSDVRALAVYGDAYHFMWRQLLWIVIAVLAGIVASRLDYHYWRTLALPAFVFSVIALALVLVPGIGLKIGGSRRWLRVAFFSVQVSELGKFGMILFLSWWMSRERRSAGEAIKGFLVPLSGMGLILLLIILEPDFGTTLLCGVVGMAIIAVGGARLRYVFGVGLAGLAGFAVMILRNPVRLQRVLAFLEPAEHAQTTGYQLLGSLDAFAQGGILGVGLGRSIQKHFYLPEAHTDFIFAIIGEELGLIASLLVVLCFAVVFVCGFIISLKAADDFGRLLAFGITFMITMQAVINIGVVTGCLPTKGLPLPFISFGGSSMVMSTLGIGVLINIANHAVGNIGDKHSNPVKDTVHRF